MISFLLASRAFTSSRVNFNRGVVVVFSNLPIPYLRCTTKSPGKTSSDHPPALPTLTPFSRSRDTIFPSIATVSSMAEDSSSPSASSPPSLVLVLRSLPPIAAHSCFRSSSKLSYHFLPPPNPVIFRSPLEASKKPPSDWGASNTSMSTPCFLARVALYSFSLSIFSFKSCFTLSMSSAVLASANSPQTLRLRSSLNSLSCSSKAFFIISSRFL
mmetsp:Transcript_10736/g.25416  ORF Transcript_10736/g.25416 Transcript_10736/m.25416 type:complete len:214 (-) Transcript_10736:612-1253(-)